MQLGDSEHWDRVYTTNPSSKLSWHDESHTVSLSFIHRYASPGSSVIDIGGGSSTLVPSLVEQGFGPCTVVDISAKALQNAREGAAPATAALITWKVADILMPQQFGTFDVWHDRAVFHFLITPEQRAQYVQTAGTTVRKGGHLILAAFRPDGPERCSGLPVCRYNSMSLASLFVPDFKHKASSDHMHITPSGAEQPFTYTVLERTGL
jgi:SAM-dependent methyltransferase